MGDRDENAELFGCTKLRCTLTKRACAERHVRGEALRLIEPEGGRTAGTSWEPQAWAEHLACRGCPLGAEHAERLAVRAPAQARFAPTITSSRRHRLEWHPGSCEEQRCRGCGAVFWDPAGELCPTCLARSRG